MRKRLLPILLATTLLFTACDSTSAGSKEYRERTNNLLEQVSGYDCLWYDEETKIVYVLFNECCGYCGYGYMSPYYAANGKPYLYIDGELKEIEE